MFRKNAVFLTILAVGMAGVAIVSRGDASSVEQAYDGKPDIVAASFTSAWCSACKVLEPRLAKVIPDFSGKPVQFIELDFTYGKNKAHERLAADYGFSDVYERFKSGTGFTLLIDAQTGAVIDTLTMNHSADAMRSAIAQSIAIATRPDPVNSN